MLNNKPVFRPSFGNRPDQLLGRDSVIDEVLEGLQTYPGCAQRATLLIGQRGMGKTALLLEIADRSKELEYIPVRITCGEAMLDNLIDLLQRAGSEFIKETKPPIKGFSAGALGFSVGLTFTEEAQRSFGFRVKLEMICEKLAHTGKHILILVDEVDPSLEQMRELAVTYQELAGNESDVAIVMAGLPSSISDILNYKTLTFLNRAQRIPLELVPISEIEAYYLSAFERASIIATPQIIKEAAMSTEGFPYSIQLIGYYLSKLATNNKPVNKEMLEKAKSLASNEIDQKVFQAILNPLSDLDISILKVISKNGGIIKTSEIETSLGISHGTIQTYRKRLLDAGVVTSPRRGELKVSFPQLADYLCRQTDE